MDLPKYVCNSLRIFDPGGTMMGEGAGDIALSAQGLIEITVRLSFDAVERVLTPPLDVIFSVAGRTDDGQEIRAPKCCLGRSEAHHIIFYAEECTIRSVESSSSFWTRRLLYLTGAKDWGPAQVWNDAKITFTLRPTRNTRWPMVVELMSEAPSPSPMAFDETREILCNLLSFAWRSPCAVPVEIVHNGDQLVKICLRSIGTAREPMHSLIDFCDIALFMTASIPRYRRFDKYLDLHLLVEYYCRSYTESTAEYMFLFASALMEALKFKWALNIRKLPKDPPDGIVKRFVKLKPDGRPNPKDGYKFQELLGMVGEDLGIELNYGFIENRNTIFHTGQAAVVQLGALDVWPALKPELRKLHEQVDELLMAILGFSGPVSPYWDMQHVIRYPTRKEGIRLP